MPILVTSDPATVRNELESTVESVIKFMMLRSLSNLTAPPEMGGTPVKSGHASASWILSVGAPSTDVGGSRENVDYGPQEAGQDAVHGYHLGQGAVFLSNNTAYIHRLNYGYSPQAKSGFVESAIARAVNETEAKFR